MSWYDSEMSMRWNVSNVWSKLTYPFSKVFWWLVKSVQYSIFLWRDFDWDYCYILLLLKYKLMRTRKRILKDNIILRAEEVAAQIKHAEDLIQNWYEDNWCEDLQKAHDEKWGEIISTFDLIKHPYMFDWKISRKNATTPELEEQERKEQCIIYDAQDKARKENFDELFVHLRKYIEEWWD